MANKIYAKEWLQKAYLDLDSLNILYVSNHYETVLKKLNIIKSEIIDIYIYE